MCTYYAGMTTLIGKDMFDLGGNEKRKIPFEISGDKIFGAGGIGIGTTFFLKRLDSFYLARARKMMRKQ